MILGTALHKHCLHNVLTGWCKYLPSLTFNRVSKILNEPARFDFTWMLNWSRYRKTRRTTLPFHNRRYVNNQDGKWLLQVNLDPHHLFSLCSGSLLLLTVRIKKNPLGKTSSCHVYDISRKKRKTLHIGNLVSRQLKRRRLFLKIALICAQRTKSVSCCVIFIFFAHEKQKICFSTSPLMRPVTATHPAIHIGSLQCRCQTWSSEPPHRPSCLMVNNKPTHGHWDFQDVSALRVEFLSAAPLPLSAFDKFLINLPHAYKA